MCVYEHACVCMTVFMLVDMCVCMLSQLFNTCVYLFRWTLGYVHVCVCVCVFVCVCVNVTMLVGVCMCVLSQSRNVCLCACILDYVCICLYVWASVCLCANPLILCWNNILRNVPRRLSMDLILLVTLMEKLVVCNIRRESSWLHGTRVGWVLSKSIAYGSVNTDKAGV